MKRNRVLSLLLAATLLFSLCFTGCAGKSAAKANSDPNGIPVRMQNGGKLRFLPEKPLTIPKLSEMVYTRPDTEKLIDDLEALTEKVHGCDDAQALLKDYYGIAVQLQNLESMDALAFYRYTANTADSSFSEEYDYCEAQYAIVEEKENDLYAAFAASPCREALEQAYFGEGFFLDYEDYSTADETYFDLKQQEKDLLFQYYELAGSADFTDSRQIERNHDASGNLLIALVKVRQKIAAAKGYEDYMDYSYACDYQRDYSTAQARAYLDRIKTLLASLTSDDRFVLGDYSYWNDSKSMEMLSSAAERMGGLIWEACRFMSEYELYDIDSSSEKMSIGYTNYIGN